MATRWGLVALVVVAACGGGEGDDAADAAADAARSDAGAGAPDASAPDASAPDASAPDATPTATLTISVAGDGEVTSDVGGLACRSDGGAGCTAVLPVGTVVTLTAAPDVDNAFAAWTGDCAGGDATTMITLTADATCGAELVGAGGDVVVMPPPLSVVPNETEGATALMFQEQSNVELAAPLPFDVHTPEAYAAPPPVGGVVPAGTRVSVYFVQLDPVGTMTVVNTVGSITFPREILAVISEETTLDATDAAIGRLDVMYPAPGTHPDRGIELAAGFDELTIDQDRRTIHIDFRTDASADQLRVITLASGDAPVIATSNLVASAPPASVAAQATESDTTIVWFDEAGAVTLAAPLAVDIDAPGLYDAPGDLVAGSIAAGEVVSSTMLHFDPVGTATLRVVTGSVTFTRPIAGIALTASALDAGDPIVGASATTYPDATGVDIDRGIEPQVNAEWLRISADRRSLRFTLQAQGAQDHFRVIFVD